jgi:1-acyl-sn-glycerol-3-phosphate acyltransferase
MNIQTVAATKQNYGFLNISDSKKTKANAFYYLSRYLALISQFLVLPIVYMFFKVFFKLKITGKTNINGIYSPFIIISNHVSTFDSFVFRLILNGKRLPLRFMAVKRFNSDYLNMLSKIYIIDILYFIFGVFIVERGRGLNKNLEIAMNILNNSGNVVIYPEGSIVSGGTIADFKVGAAVLAKNTRVQVIPIAMKIYGKSIRRNFTVNIGPVIKNNSDSSVEKLTEYFQDTVMILHNEI